MTFLFLRFLMSAYTYVRYVCLTIRTLVIERPMAKSPPLHLQVSVERCSLTASRVVACLGNDSSYRLLCNPGPEETQDYQNSRPSSFFVPFLLCLLPFSFLLRISNVGTGFGKLAGFFSVGRRPLSKPSYALVATIEFVCSPMVACRGSHLRNTTWQGSFDDDWNRTENAPGSLRPSQLGSWNGGTCIILVDHVILTAAS
ncbi:hypothetical protein LY78DRAFT_187472 [Colletotrichum sublineola]|nr:hypothetical protein LY78DRAFT_187472 [Colletotrichum sublineola]